MKRPHVSIVVANWQGADWIARCVSSLQLSARNCGLPYELIVVDDASTDDSVRIIQERLSSVKLLRNPRNIGFGAATMRGVHESQGRILILCNNDLVVKEEFVPRLVRWFEKPVANLRGRDIPRSKLFGISARTVSWFDGTPNQLCMGAAFHGGRITPAWSDPSQATQCLFVQAGAAAYNRALFLRLGGFNKVFDPGYWEDYDISYKAAQAGYINIYDPEALALHHGGGSMTRRFGNEGVHRMKARNHLLFEWMNIADKDMMVRYSARLVASVGREWISGGNPRLTRALLDALPALPSVMRERARRRIMRSDHELLRIAPGEPSY